MNMTNKNQMREKSFTGKVAKIVVRIPEIDNNISFEDYMLESDCFGDTSQIKLSLPCWGVTSDEIGGSMFWGRFVLWPGDEPQFCDGLTFYMAVSMWLDCEDLNISKEKGQDQ